MKYFFVLAFGMIAGLLPTSAKADSLVAMTTQESVQYYQSRYKLSDPYAKLVDNYGNGFDALYGTRNLRAVLSGIVYRGGANNAYDKHGKRNNQNPLPHEGLQHLCEEGFGQAVYLYGTNFSSAPKSVTCTTATGAKNQLNYASISPLGSPAAAKSILKMVYDKLTTGDDRPTYLHCWNGWHASGYISALALRQFCGWNEDAAVDYWNKNTDGAYKGFDSIRSQIRAFTPDPQMQLPSGLQALVCPH